MKFDGDDLRSDSDATSDYDDDDPKKSASASSDEEGNTSLLTASPLSANALSSGLAGTPSSRSKIKKKVEADIRDYNEIMASLMQESKESKGRPKTPNQKAGAQTSFSINY